MSHLTKIASEASYVHFMSGQKLIKNAKILMSAFSFPDEARISLVSEDHEDQLSSRGG